MSRAPGATNLRRIAVAMRFAAVAVAVGLLALAMFGAMAIAVLTVVAVVGALLGR